MQKKAYILNHTGKIYTLLVHKEKENQISSYNPSLYKELPIRLEDIFQVTSRGGNFDT